MKDALYIAFMSGAYLPLGVLALVIPDKDPFAPFIGSAAILLSAVGVYCAWKVAKAEVTA